VETGEPAGTPRSRAHHARLAQDGTQAPTEPSVIAPVVILVRPQLAENIGMCARAMANFGLSEMRLVAPREGWPKKGAHQAASGAVHILNNAKLFETVPDAVADLNKVYATTARERGLHKEHLSGEEAAQDIFGRGAAGQRLGILFGPERAGLDNDDIALADVIVSYPVTREFPSLNLAQAVLLIGYEWWKLKSGGAAPIAPTRLSPPAERSHLIAFFSHIEAELDAAGFFNPPDKRPRMIRNFRNIFHRMDLTAQDVQTLRGAVTALVEGRRKAREQSPQS
jgi:tRNA/rRNA methyltransferase